MTPPGGPFTSPPAIMESRVPPEVTETHELKKLISWAPSQPLCLAQLTQVFGLCRRDLRRRDLCRR